MTTFAAAFAGFLVAMLALAIGLVVDDRQLRGSCGGTAKCVCSPLRARSCPQRAAAAAQHEARDENEVAR